jgi:hypothetical protein
VLCHQTVMIGPFSKERSTPSATQVIPDFKLGFWNF